MKTRNKIAILMAVMVLSTGCDQVTKQIATAGLKESAPRSYLWNSLRLQYSENPGGFLSLGSGLSDDTRAGVFMIGVGILLAATLAYALASRRLQPASVAALALFLSGGFSNWADRLAHGNVVVDFMIVGVGPLRTGIFNVADLCIVGGVALLLWSEILSARPQNSAEMGGVSPVASSAGATHASGSEAEDLPPDRDS